MRVMDPPSESDLETLRAFEREHGLRLYLQPKGLDSVRRLDRGGGGACPQLPAAGLRSHPRLQPHRLHPGERGHERGPGVAGRSSCCSRSRAHGCSTCTADLGNFTLALARAVGPSGQVVGVEGDRELVRRGGENARRNGISNAEFHMADLMQPLPATQLGPCRGGGSMPARIPAFLTCFSTHRARAHGKCCQPSHVWRRSACCIFHVIRAVSPEISV